MKPKHYIAIGAFLAACTVVLGAMGAHALKPTLEASDNLGRFESALRYHTYHAMALVLIGILRHLYRGKWVDIAGMCFLVGILMFSGSLYLLTLKGINLGVVTPIGGMSYIIGWLVLCIGALVDKQSYSTNS